jgi:hypothetical protein
MDEITKSIPFPAIAIILVTMSFLGIGYFKKQLAERHASDVRAIWYLFFLALIATVIAAEWGTSVGAIDEKGNFHGSLGAAINSLLKFMLKIDDDIRILCALLAMVLGPQIGSYLFSGIVGCASAPVLVGRSLTIFTWSIAKSFVSASGVLMAISIYGEIKGWSGWDIKGATAMAGISLVLLLLSFYVLLTYREISDASNTTGSVRYENLRQRISAWMSRNVRQEG